MSNTLIINNLEHLMQLHGNLTVTELARLTSIPQSTLHHILSGVTKSPRKNALESLANFFAVSVEQLTGVKPLPNVIPDALKARLQINTLPILNWDDVKTWPTNRNACHHDNEIIFDKPISPDSFALVQSDSSKDPLFPADSLLVFEYGKQPADRSYAIIDLCDDSPIMFNRIFIDDHTTYIKQEHSDKSVGLIKLDDHAKVIATLVEVRLQY